MCGRLALLLRPLRYSTVLGLLERNFPTTTVVDLSRFYIGSTISLNNEDIMLIEWSYRETHARNGQFVSQAVADAHNEMLELQSERSPKRIQLDTQGVSALDAYTDIMSVQVPSTSHRRSTFLDDVFRRGQCRPKLMANVVQSQRRLYISQLTTTDVSPNAALYVEVAISDAFRGLHRHLCPSG
ncbi:hypothetical protein E5676_scaffold1163G00210 [Cucumis melo var. makuwa]|uniref:CACTA en-spm transposon protein n=1 Tax=Cucumis melo var. makuwa TaxID=1194695 RepID=A0A5D3DGH6_CUCMM|nr:hypothetical protein E5676_scaffold1163G00210 [Cucumis melo var. makuwa]